MDFWDLTKLLFRRWYIAAPLLLLAAASTGVVAVTIQPDYVSTSYVQLIPPTATADPEDPDAAPAPRNPWFDLGLGSLSRAAIITVQDQTVLDQLEEDGYSTNFTIGFDTQLPVITFEVIGDTEQQATETTEELVRRFSESVAALQSEYGVSGDESITTRRLDLGDNLTESTSKIKRALVAIAGAGVLLSAGITVAIDAWLRRRARRRAIAAGEIDPTEGPGGGVADRSASRTDTTDVAASGRPTPLPMNGQRAESAEPVSAKSWQSAHSQPVGATPPQTTAAAGPAEKRGVGLATELPGAAGLSGPLRAADGVPAAGTPVPGPRKAGNEYRSNMGGAEPQTDRIDRTPATDDTAVIAIQSDDATMVLPRATGDRWVAKSNGSKPH
ncbi:hypothetical protein O7623_13860 [Solwaraspora sp. WMMD791]|uniref:hypothetical protein n=1 Tax=Solwaraspora sp. WMMD791 TaxID=3016086 RepID=UPI00249B9855|nr:hypothetical protein [Solwaraspora sp. WMMD791]WFE30199.1 hypothetical protein O7623_13860 [Solwaraspora sp. WMMD791]